MDQYEDFHKESSDEEVQVVPPAPVAVVEPLKVEVPEIPDNPESPSPQPSPISSGGSSPVAVGGPPVPRLLGPLGRMPRRSWVFTPMKTW